MVKEGLVAGLKNAVERGENLERAKYSFISAGYSKEEVEEAARSVQGGSVLVQEKKLTMPVSAIQPAKSTKPIEPIKPSKPIEGSVKTKIKMNLKVIMLIVILIVLIGILLSTVLFRETILGWFA